MLRSDDEFFKCELSKFDFIILDPWTWAAKGKILQLTILVYDIYLYIYMILHMPHICCGINILIGTAYVLDVCIYLTINRLGAQKGPQWQGRPDIHLGFLWFQIT